MRGLVSTPAFCGFELVTGDQNGSAGLMEKGSIGIVVT